MKKAISVLSVIFSATAFHISAEIPQDMQQEFSAPGPAGKIKVRVSGECRGTLIYEARDFYSQIYVSPNSPSHASFTADVPNAHAIQGSIESYSIGDKHNYSIKKGKLNFNFHSKNPMYGSHTAWIADKDLKNIRCKNGQDMKTYLEENQGSIHSMPTEKTKLSQSLKFTGKEAPYNYRMIIKNNEYAMFTPICQVSGDLTNGLQSNFYKAQCQQKTKILVKTSVNLKGRATPLPM